MKTFQISRSSVIILTIALWLSGCSKPVDSFKSKGFLSAEEFIENPAIRNAWSTSGVTFYSDVRPPNIEGKYSAAGCHYYAKSVNPNIDRPIGQHLSDTLKFYDQTRGGTLLAAEKTKASGSSFSLFSGGANSFIRGQDAFFTLFTENRNSDGSTSVSIMSGILLSSDSIQVKKVTIAVTDLPTGIEVGDWFASKGVLVRYP